MNRVVIEEIGNGHFDQQDNAVELWCRAEVTVPWGHHPTEGVQPRRKAVNLCLSMRVNMYLCSFLEWQYVDGWASLGFKR